MPNEARPPTSAQAHVWDKLWRTIAEHLAEQEEKEKPGANQAENNQLVESYEALYTRD